MHSIKLKDGQIREFDGQVTGLDIATSISKGLAKQAIAIRVNGELQDLTRIVENGAEIEIVTYKDEEALEILRHDAAHVMAEAVQELFPDTQVTIGPAIENGFYYDFYRQEPFTPADLEKIEQRMHEIIDRDEPIVRDVWTKEQAVQYYLDKGEDFKAEIVREIPDDEDITIYTQGNFVDPCRGPHLPSTGKLAKAFKLMKVAGAYWRGDSNNPMLQRIYGTAWATEKQLKQYLTMLEEAEKRDHRKLGPQLGLFHMQEEAAGSVFWHQKGWQLYRNIENYIRKKLEDNDYIEVKTPQILDKEFWEKSGHWDKFREMMFTVESKENRTLAVKPMNCPCHVQIFKQGIKSYRDLPLRMAEFGSCHRNEPTGAMHGLMRVRAFVQDDAHIFCTPEQIVTETKAFCDLLKSVYSAFDFKDIRIKFADRPEVRAGEDEIWDQAEQALIEAADSAGLEYTLNPGEGAFYGPKLEFVLRDALGRDWQCGTLQVDFVLPERLDASYVGEDGQKHRPVMLHRAILGSFERFLGVLIEHYAGKFPLWLSPVQIVVATISDAHSEYAEQVKNELAAKGLRVETDLRNEKISYKVREHSHNKIPVILVVGDKEREQRAVTMRRIGSKENMSINLDEALQSLSLEAKQPE